MTYVLYQKYEINVFFYENFAKKVSHSNPSTRQTSTRQTFNNSVNTPLREITMRSLFTRRLTVAPDTRIQ